MLHLATVVENLLPSPDVSLSTVRVSADCGVATVITVAWQVLVGCHTEVLGSVCWCLPVSLLTRVLCGSVTS